MNKKDTSDKKNYSGEKQAQETPSEKFSSSPEAVAFVSEFCRRLVGNNPKHKPFTSGQLAKWAHEAELMVHRDGRTWEEATRVMVWSQEESFWKTVVLSVPKFREKFDQLVVKMKGGRNGREQRIQETGQAWVDRKRHEEALRNAQSGDVGGSSGGLFGGSSGPE